MLPISQGFFDETLLSKTHVLARQNAYYKRGVEQFLLLALTRKSQKLVGYTDVIIEPRTPTVVYQKMTGIMPEYRGKGLSKLLKARMVVYLLKALPNLTRIRTEIHPDNVRSQGLNRKMGFQKVGVYKEYVISPQAILNYRNSS